MKKLFITLMLGITILPLLSQTIDLWSYQYRSLAEISTDIATLTQTQPELGISLNLSNREIPEEFFKGPGMKNITRLRLDDCSQVSLPNSIGELTNLRSLEITNYPLLTSLPESISRLSQLRELTVSETQLKTFPESIGTLQQLQVLDAKDNQIETLPDSLWSIGTLQKLDLRRNKLRELSDHWTNLTGLTELRITDNPFQCLPIGIQQAMASHKYIVDLYKNCYECAHLYTFNSIQNPIQHGEYPVDLNSELLHNLPPNLKLIEYDAVAVKIYDEGYTMDSTRSVILNISGRPSTPITCDSKFGDIARHTRLSIPPSEYFNTPK